MPIYIRNPHSVLAALEMRPRDVLQVTVPAQLAAAPERASAGDTWAKVVKVARERKVPIHTIPQKSRGTGNGARQPTKHQEEMGRTSSTEAIIQEKMPISLEEMFKNARNKSDGKGLWLALDSLQDPQNVGAIFRAASFFGVEGLILTQERSAPISSVVYDVSCGGVEYISFVSQINLQQAFEAAKDAGLWILGTSEHAQDSVWKIQKDRPWLLVLGNEERGIRRLTEESCDLLCAIPGHGKVTSLNVSVAAGVLISHLTNK